MRQTVMALGAALYLLAMPGAAPAQGVMQRACDDLTQAECAFLQNQLRLLREGRTTVDAAKAELCAAKPEVPCPRIERQVDALLEQLPQGMLPESGVEGAAPLRVAPPPPRPEGLTAAASAAGETSGAPAPGDAAEAMTMPQLIEALNRVAPAGQALSCTHPGSDDCRARLDARVAEVLAGLDTAALSPRAAADASALADWRAARAPAPAEAPAARITDRSARSSGEERAAGAAAMARIGGVPVPRLRPGMALGDARVVAVAGDRVVVRQGSDLRVRHDPETLIRRPGTTVAVEKPGGARARTSTVTRPDGTRVISRYDWKGELAYRARIAPSGRTTVLIDERARRMGQDAPRGRDDALGRALADAERDIEAARRPMVWQVRWQAGVRDRAPRIAGQDIVFAPGSAVVTPGQARRLAGIGREVRAILARDPAALFLVEGHTDAVGDRADNLVLSDRRAESVALALIEYYDAPPENLLFQGYGEAFPEVAGADDRRRNRRTVVRHVSPVLGPQG